MAERTTPHSETKEQQIMRRICCCLCRRPSRKGDDDEDDDNDTWSLDNISDDDIEEEKEESSCKECPICYEERRRCDLFSFSERCKHLVCLECAVRHVRTSEMVRGGIQCPMLRRKNGQRCRARMNFDELKKLCQASRNAANDITSPYFSMISYISSWFSFRLNNDSIALADTEMQRLEKQYIRSAFSRKEKIYSCPACGEMFVDNSKQQVTHARCRACGIEFCAHCGVSWHSGKSCDEFQTAAQFLDDTQEVLRLTSKKCPGCNALVTHFHGHNCHHISPVTNGCPHCHIHFCYSCLSIAKDNEKKRGQRSKCLCGSWSKFCQSQNIKEFLAFVRPAQGKEIIAAYDTRCGCPLCFSCRPNQPCALCDGNCVVCTGQVYLPLRDEGG